MDIHLRPHHFLCALCFQGRGYSSPFIENFKTIMHSLRAEQGDEIAIHITQHTDTICSPCPHRQEKLCASQDKITRLDQAHADALKITTEQTITWGEAKNRIKENIDLNTFHQICADCEWKSLGICESMLTHFLTQ